MRNLIRGVTAALLLAVLPLAANAGVFVSVTIAPPVLPVYELPAVPGPGYVWTPGYWAWADGGYYWVPGTVGARALAGAAVDPGLLGLRRRHLPLARRLLGPARRLLWRHQLRVRLQRRRLPRRLLARRHLHRRPRRDQRGAGQSRVLQRRRRHRRARLTRGAALRPRAPRRHVRPAAPQRGAGRARQHHARGLQSRPSSGRGDPQAGRVLRPRRGGGARRR